MKDEIKIILEYLKCNDTYEVGNGDYEKKLYKYEINLLLDYIINLQEENERLKKALCKDNIVSKCKYDYLKRQKEGLELDLFCIKDYKSRCEKAIEYIKNINERAYKDDYGTYFSTYDLLNILQGDHK